MARSVWRRRFVPEAVLALLAGAVFIGYLIQEKAIAGQLGFSSDDAWIHFCFARNLVEGGGFSYTPGVPVAGSTAPLWTLVCAVFLAVFGNPVTAGKVAGFVGWLFVGWGIYHLVRDLTRSVGVAVGAAVLAMVQQYTIWGALSGLEVMLYSALVIWAIVFHLRCATNPRVPYVVVSALLFLAGVSRPEFFALVPLFWIARWWPRPGSSVSPVHRGREMLWSALAGLVVLGPYVGFNLWTIGRPFPLTFYAKSGGTGLIASLSAFDVGGVLGSVFVTAPEHLLTNYQFALFVAVPAMVGGWYLAFHVWLLPQPLRSRLVFPAAVPLFYLIARAIAVGGVYGAFARYCTFVFPLGAAVAVIACWAWATRQASGPPPFFRVLSGVAAVVIAVIVIVAASGGPTMDVLIGSLLPWIKKIPKTVAARLGGAEISSAMTVAYWLGPLLATGLGVLWSYRKLAGSRVVLLGLWCTWGVVAVFSAGFWTSECAWAVKNINDVNVATARWLNNNTPADATIAVNDIGAVGYFVRGRRIVDLMGLVEPEILPYRAEGGAGIWRYLEVRRPDYVAVFDTWFPDFAGRGDVLVPVHAIRAANYTLWGHHTKTIYRAHWDGDAAIGRGVQ